MASVAKYYEWVALAEAHLVDIRETTQVLAVVKTTAATY